MLSEKQSEIMAECSKHLIAAWQNPQYPVTVQTLAHMAASFLAGVRIGFITGGYTVDVADTITDPLVLILPVLVERISQDNKPWGN